MNKENEESVKTLRDLAEAGYVINPRAILWALNKLLETEQKALRRLMKAEHTLISAGYTDKGGELWRPPLGHWAETVEGFKVKDELAFVKEQLRRLTLYTQANTNLVTVDDLCEHGAESGCCFECSAKGSKT